MFVMLGELFKKKFAVRINWWNFYVPIFHNLVKLLHHAENPYIGWMVRRAALINDKKIHFTQGTVIPLEAELNKKGSQGSTVMPIHLVEKLIREAPDRYIVHRCLCRDGNNCQDFPHDHACIFLGQGSHVTYENGISRKASVEEAIEHLHKGVELGLICQCLWIEAEQYFWGFPKDKMQNFLEVCFCCPCCCLSLNSCKKITEVFGDRIQSIGWEARVSGDCIACGKCVEVCPMHAIVLGEEQAEIQGRCIGCGLCASNCPTDAMELYQKAPLKDDIKDYFWGFRPDV
ncbi:indolepyruvate ferredoxin oxidoreductase subunit alpha [Desulfatibacillum aliphaticivorans]|uniref:indolepyruvate ferredoxin oxidoreductase subunit alpha n=1 Tax=Desulfatibacillum aliphaticivorans TaxID=218208 RepID=UPI000427A137|nr:4Fe-4S binding protein [Desulfatibacillum aliphaticivorans]